MISRENALKLSAWLAVHEPQLFRQMLATTQKMQRTPLGRLGFFGDDSGLAEITVTADSAPPPDVSFSLSPDPTLTDISFDPGSVSLSSDVADSISNTVAQPPSIDSSLTGSSQSGGGFWSSIGSGISSVAGAVGKVASGLASPQTFAALGSTATAYFNAQARSAQTAAQQAAVNTQLTRVARGAAPAPITYAINPVTGQLTPVYQTNTGAQPLTGAVLSRLQSPGGTPSTWLIGGAIAVIIVISLMAAR